MLQETESRQVSRREEHTFRLSMRHVPRKTAFAFSFALGLLTATPSGSAQPLAPTPTSVTMVPQVVQPGFGETDATVSPDGRLVAALMNLGVVHVWDIESGTILRTFAPPGATKFTFTKDSRRLRYVTLTIINGKGTLVSGDLDLVTGQTTQAVGPAGIFHSLMVPGGEHAILGETPSGTIHVYDLTTNKIIRSFGTLPPTGRPPNELDPRTISAMSVSTDGNVLLLSRVSGALELWDVEHAKPRYAEKNAVGAIGPSVAKNGSRAAFLRSNAIELFDGASGKPLRRIPVGSGTSGLTLSADGHWALTTSSTKNSSVHLWNLETGEETRSATITESRTTTTLAFVNENHFVWGGGHGLEIRGFSESVPLRQLVADKPHAFSVTSAAVNAQLDSAFATGLEGGTMQLLSWDLTRLGLQSTVSQGPGSAKIAANGSRMWSLTPNGFAVLDLKTQKQRNIMRDTGTSFGGNFVISGDGQKLIVAGERRGSDPMTNRTWPEIVLSEWDAESGSKIDKLVRQKTDSSRTVLTASKDGRFVVTTDYGAPPKHTEVHLWDLERDTLMQTFDLGTTTHIAAAVSDNGQLLALAFMEASKPGGHTVQIVDIPSGKVRTSIASSIVGLAQAIAFSPSGDKIALGNRTVEVYHTAVGTLAHAFRGDLQWITSLGFSADGKYLLTAGYAGMMNLYRLDKPASVTMLRAGEDWLVYDEDGYFDASRRGGSLVAAVDELHAHSIDQLAVRNNRPDLLLERMGLGDPSIIRHFRAQYEKRLAKLSISNESALPTFRTTPEVTLTNVEVIGPTAHVAFEAKARGANLLRYNIFVNDVPLLGTLGDAAFGRMQRVEKNIELVSGRNKIEVSAMDALGGESLRAVKVVERKDVARGDLFYLGFGVSKYKNPKYNLGFPHKDVTDLGDVLRAGAGKKFGKVHVRTYVNETATVENIRRAKEFLKDARVDDTVVLFIAGHGVHSPDANADYFFATHEVEPKNLSKTAARFEVVEDLLAGIRPLKKLFLMDTCESGERDKEDAPSEGLPAAARTLVRRSARQLELDVAYIGGPQETPSPKRKYYDRERYIYNDLSRRTGAIVISSSRGSEFSYELEELANGVFTEELLLALTTTQADRDHDGMVSTDELRWHLGQAVPKRTNDEQHPTVDRDNLDVRFGFPVVTEAASIVTRTVLPVQEGAPDEKSVAPRQTPLATVRPRGCGCQMVEPEGLELGVLLAALGAMAARLRRAKRSGVTF